MRDKNSTAIDIEPLLACSTPETRRNITVLEYVKEMLRNRGQVHLDTTNSMNYDEPNSLVFRFADLVPGAQDKLARILKHDSSIWTVRNIGGPISLEMVKETLTAFNPIIFSNFGREFYMGSINRWRERKLSHLVYHAAKKFRNTSGLNWLISRSCEW